MKKDLIDSLNSENNFTRKNKPNTCSICNSDKLPIDVSKKSKYEIKILLSRFKLKETELSNLIKKCNCTKTSPKVHKLCILLNVLYNFELKCNECNTNYNIVVNHKKNSAKNICKFCSLILYLLINIILYGSSAFLILYPLLINKDCEKKLFHIYFFFGGLIFLLNSYFIYVTILSILYQNPEDINDYTVDVKDISEANKNKNLDKYFALLYKFYRYFYKTQIRYLIGKKHKNVYISKGYGYFNKDLKDLIIKNNKEIFKERRPNNGGNDILILNINNNDKNGLNTLQDKTINKNNKNNNNNNIVNQSNGNNENNDFENIKRSSTLIDDNTKKPKESLNNNTKNKTANLPQIRKEADLNHDKNYIDISKKQKEQIKEKEKKNDENKEKEKEKEIEIEWEIEKKKEKEKEKEKEEEKEKKEEKQKEEEKEKKEEKQKEEDKEKEKEKKIIVEVINTDKQININNEVKENNQKIELKSKLDNDNDNIKQTKISGTSKKSKNTSNSKIHIEKEKENDLIEEKKSETISQKDINKNNTNSIDKNNENGDKLKFDDDANSKKKLINQDVIFNDNFNLFISSPFHNNGK